MRGLAVLGIVIAAACAGAQEAFGTKADPISRPIEGAAPAIGIMPFVQMLFALGIVFALVKYVLPKVLNKVGPKLAPATGSGIRIEEAAAFPGGNLFIVNARGRSLLMSVTTAGANLLADLTVAVPEEPTFLDVLEEKERDLDEIAQPRLPSEDIEAALARLSQLSS